jgi:hypothetical protein
MRITALFVALFTAACSSSNTDDLGGRILVAPGNYNMYTCVQIANTKAFYLTRQRSLEVLINKAGDGLDGRIVSATTYQPEYITNKGLLDSLRRTEVEKGCQVSPVKSN